MNVQFRYTMIHPVKGEFGGPQKQKKKEKCREAKWLSEEALQTAEKRREVKGKGEKERYTHLNAEFQRIAKRQENLLKKTMQRKRGNQYNGKDQIFL